MNEILGNKASNKTNNLSTEVGLDFFLEETRDDRNKNSAEETNNIDVNLDVDSGSNIQGTSSDGAEPKDNQVAVEEDTNVTNTHLTNKNKETGTSKRARNTKEVAKNKRHKERLEIEKEKIALEREKVALLKVLVSRMGKSKERKQENGGEQEESDSN